VITFNYPLWSAGDICLFDSSAVPLFEGADGDEQGDYPFFASFNAVSSTFSFSMTVLDEAYLGMDKFGFVGTSTLTGLIADDIPSCIIYSRLA